MEANTDVVFSTSVIAQMEATVGFSFTFGSFPEVTVPRNPASDSPAAGGNVSDSRIRELRCGGHANQGDPSP
jgi:hypothetical protein